jgi:hypothetical protein
MQFFLPSLIAFIIAAVVVFAVLPRLAGPTLVGLSVLILGFALYQHVALFKSEYALSTWQEQLKFYAPFVMVAALLLSVLVYFGVISGGSTAALPTPTLPISPVLPPANTATNPLTAALNTGIRTVSSPFTTTNNQNRSYFTATNQNRSFFSPV